MKKKFLLHPHAPIWAGSTLVFVLCWILIHVSGGPGPLAHAHDQIPGLRTLDSCETCHTPNGINSGCLSCHEEIEAQLDDNTGYHGFLETSRGSECADCHTEHHGLDFHLVNQISWGAQTEGTFEHPHVEYLLEGSHDELTCADCHSSAKKFTLSGFETMPRRETFLGVDQECASCHADVHSEGLTGSCLECHDQHAFDEPHFDHTPHMDLVGGHDQLLCEQCHDLPSADTPPAPLPFPFEETFGQTCVECHGTPHRMELGETCTECHEPEHGHWLAGRDKITPELHARTGFPLSDPHTAVSCEGCHPSELAFDLRHPDPNDPSYARHPDTCEGCHEDEHGGQFEGRHDHCVECHSPLRFTPTMFGHDDHAAIFDLSGAHQSVACTACHTQEHENTPRTFVGTPDLCRDCHIDPHAGQFDERLIEDDCSQCHLENADSFVVGNFDHFAQTGFDLLGAHGRASCSGCHQEGTIVHQGIEVTTNIFSKTPQECASCHIDVHRGQFEDYDSCDVCHTSHDHFSEITFDHDTQSEWPLVGAHRDVPCARCHLPEPHADGGEVVRYKPIPHECGDCHDIVPESER